MKLCARMTSHVRTTELYIIGAIYFYRSFKSSFIIFIFSSNFHINTVMYCPGCGSEHNSVEEMYCGKTGIAVIDKTRIVKRIARIVDE